MNTIKKIELKVSRIKLAENRAFYGKKVSCSADIAKIAKKILEHEDQEVAIVFHMSPRNEVIGYSEVARGSLASCALSISAVFRTAIVNGAANIIFCHNHPSGETSPSQEDTIMSKKIAKAADTLGIRMLDSIIVASVADDYVGYFSYVDSGLSLLT